MEMKEVIKGKKAQVWVETVIYTLIGLAIIGILLAVVRPKIEETQDKLAIEQTIESMNKINDKVFEVRKFVGNRRIVELKVSQGKFIINSDEDRLDWIIDSSYQYSELGEDVSLGDLNVKTTQVGDDYEVSISLDYNFNIISENQRLDPAPSPYSLVIENTGDEIEFSIE